MQLPKYRNREGSAANDIGNDTSAEYVFYVFYVIEYLVMWLQLHRTLSQNGSGCHMM